MGGDKIKMALMQQESFNGDPNAMIDVDFLLPTGILISVKCKGGDTVSAIKDVLWTEAEKHPLFHVLRQVGWYVFVFVNRKAEQEECLDESQRLCDLQLYKPLFKVVERRGNEAEKKLSNEISWLIGSQVKEFEISRNSEITDFRIMMVDKCKEAIQHRANFNWLDQLLYCYPPSIEGMEGLSELIKDKLTPENCYRVSVDFSSLGKLGQSTTILLDIQDTPTELVEKSLKKVHRVEGEPELSSNPHDYILKVHLCNMAVSTKVLGILAHTYANEHVN